MRWPDAGAGAPGKSPKPRTDKLLDVVVDEAAVLDAPLHANTTPRIAFLRHLIALLGSQPDTPFLGQLKALLTGPGLESRVHAAPDRLKAELRRKASTCLAAERGRGSVKL